MPQWSTANGRILGFSSDREQVFVELRLGIPKDSVVTLPQLEPPQPSYRCSFCFKGQDEVKKLVVSSAATICDECIELSAIIVANDATQPPELKE